MEGSGKKDQEVVCYGRLTRYSPIIPGSPVGAGGRSRTGDFLLPLVPVWAGPSTAAPALLELQRVFVFVYASLEWKLVSIVVGRAVSGLQGLRRPVLLELLVQESLIVA